MNFSEHPDSAQLIVHADDFGISVAQSHRILECSSLAGGTGALNSVSVLVTGPQWEQCAGLLDSAAESMRIGLHVNLVDGPCLSNPADVPLLANASGVLRQSWAGLLGLSVRAHDNLRVQVATEVGAQIDAFLNCFPGRAHRLRIDSHQHTHLVPAVFEGVVDAVEARGCAVEYFRIPAEPLLPFVSAGVLTSVRPVNWAKHVVLNVLWRRCKGKVPGIMDRSAVFCGVAFSGAMTEEHVGAVLPALRAYARERGRALEVLFHPGGVENAKECLNPELPGFVDFYTSPNRQLEAQAVRRLAV